MVDETEKQHQQNVEQQQKARKESVERQMSLDKEASDRSRKQAQEQLAAGKPTPTQEENDRAKLGDFVVEKEDDGSGPDTVHERNMETQRGKQSEGSKPGVYSTRDVQSAPKPAARTSIPKE